MKRSKSTLALISMSSLLLLFTFLSATLLSSSFTHADTVKNAIASVTVSDICTIEDSIVTTAHTVDLNVNSYVQNIGETSIKVTCNDNNGYSLYAVGFSGDAVGNTNLVGATTGDVIPTGVITDKSVSNWAMKLTAVSGTFTPTIVNDYDNYHNVPSTTTKVATRTDSMDSSSYSEIKTTYAVAIAPSQAVDTYVGAVKYTFVHPNNASINTELRQNIEVVGLYYDLGGPYAAGQCTQWAWYMWQQDGRMVPSNWGNANTWGARAAAEGYQVDHTPEAGAIVQSSSSYYGQVGYVETVNPDGSIIITEMNYAHIPYQVTRSTIPAAYVADFLYIH